MSLISSSSAAGGRRETTAYVCSAVLAILAIAYLVNGLNLLVAPDFDRDLTTIWREQVYMVRGVDPYDVSALHTGQQLAPSEQARIAEHGVAHERHLDPSGYPPWGLGTFFVVIPPGPLHVVQYVFAAECLLCLGLAVWFAYAAARKYGKPEAVLLASSVAAMFANCSTLRLGQLGLVLNAFLILYLLALAKGWKLASGLALAVAAMKPTFGGLQVVAAGVRRQWLQLVVIAAFWLVMSAVPTLLTGVGPVELIGQMLGQSPYNTSGDTSLLLVARAIIPYSVAFPALSLAALLGTIAIAYRYRGASILVAMSAAAVLGRVLLYHRQYDNIMLMVPLLTLGLVAFATRRSQVWAAFAVFALSLFLPLPYTAYTSGVIVAISAVWLAGLMVICRHASSLGGVDKFGPLPQ